MDVQQSKVVSALIAKGATREQANGYMTLVRMFEKQSAGKGELHHILPRNSGWWKKCASAKWNNVRIEWALHIALHAYLFHIFPKNSKLHGAVRATVMTRKKVSPKKARLKEWIIQQYEKGKSGEWIADRTRLSDVTVRRWLIEWGISLRSLSDSHASHEKNIFKERIIGWYRNEKKSSTWIAKRVGIGDQAIMRWLRSWGIKTRTTGETNHFVRTGSVREEQKHIIIDWYTKGKSGPWIARRLGVSAQTAYSWLRQWGIKRRNQSQSNHVIFHLNRNIIKTACKFCEAQMPAAA